MPVGIDINRGMLQRSSEGRMISMYTDDPGTYYYTSGEIASEEEAEKLGFDVKRHAAAKRKRDLEREARKKIEEEVAEELAQATVEIDGEEVPIGPGPEHEVIRWTTEQEPRETRARVQKWKGPKIGWSVIEKATGRELYVGKETSEAQRILQGGE